MPFAFSLSVVVFRKITEKYRSPQAGCLHNYVRRCQNWERGFLPYFRTSRNAGMQKKRGCEVLHSPAVLYQRVISLSWADGGRGRHGEHVRHGDGRRRGGDVRHGERAGAQHSLRAWG